MRIRVELMKPGILLGMLVPLLSAACIILGTSTPGAYPSTEAPSSLPTNTAEPVFLANATPGLAHPQTEPAWLAFVSARDDGIGDIFVVKSDGSGLQNLTNDPGGDSSPAWSPDGMHIAFISSRDGDFEIFVMNADGSDLRQLTDNDEDDSDFDWSPDGSQIVFSSDVDGDYDIYVMASDGSGVRPLTVDSDMDQQWPRWSPSGARIVYLTMPTDSMQPDLYVMNADGSAQAALTDIAADVEWPVWSPDGRFIAFVLPSYPGDIYLLSAEGTGLINLTHSPGDQDRYPVWSPDGIQIAFASDRDGDLEIYVMNTDGSGVRQLTHNSVEDYLPVWSSDSSQLAYHSASSMGSFGDIFILDVDTADGFNLSDDPAQDQFPDWRP